MLENKELSARKFLVTLITIVLVGALFQLFHHHITIGSDDQRWIITAQDCGEWKNPGDLIPVYYQRLGFSCLIKSWGTIVGGVTLEYSTILMFILAAATTMMLGYSAKVAGFGSVAGIATAAIYAFHPFVILYGALNLPDVLATTLQALSILLFFLYLNRRNYYFLAIAGVVVGFCYGVKVYYILMAASFGLAILWERVSWTHRLYKLIVLTATFLIGIFFAVMLPWILGGSSLSGPDINEYSQRLFTEYHPYTTGIGWALRVVAERLNYIKWLFYDVGIVSGLLSLIAIFWLMLKRPLIPEQVFLLSAFFIFFIFLTATPIKSDPLIFVEMQPRYLMVIIPILAIGAGSVLATLKFENESSRYFFYAVFIALLSNIALPNDYHDPVLHHARTQEMMGLLDAIKSAESLAINEIVLPSNYRTLVPDSYRDHGVKLTFEEHLLNTHIESSKLSHQAVFLPRARFRPLVTELKRGNFTKEMEIDDSNQELLNYAIQNKLSPHPILVPDSVFFRWLASFELVKKEQQLVGWLYINKEY